MSKHRLKMLAFLSVAAVAPASAGRLNVTPAHDGPCPYEEQAKLAAAGYERLPASVIGDPTEGSLFDPGRRSAILAP